MKKYFNSLGSILILLSTIFIIQGQFNLAFGEDGCPDGSLPVDPNNFGDRKHNCTCNKPSPLPGEPPPPPPSCKSNELIIALDKTKEKREYFDCEEDAGGYCFSIPVCAKDSDCICCVKKPAEGI